MIIRRPDEKKYVPVLGLIFLNVACRSILVKLFFSDSLLIDIGYRVEEKMANDDPIVLAGKETKKIIDFFRSEKRDNDKEYFLAITDYFR